MSLLASIRHAQMRPSSDPQWLASLAAAALQGGEEEAAAPVLLDGARRIAAPVLWQWAGLLLRSLDEHRQALDCFESAVRLAPNDARIAHGHARVALEAGVDSTSLFERARQLAPADGEVLLGLAAARLAAGEGERAASELEAILHQVPAWTTGHEQLAQIRATIGQRPLASQSLERAIAAMPGDARLWHTLFGLHLRAESFAALRHEVARAARAGVAEAELQIYQAICAGELDPATEPAPLFEAAPPNLDPALNIWRIRHLLRVGAPERAAALIDGELASDRAPFIWPYASLAWRILRDERLHWLERGAALVEVIDLTSQLPPLDELAGLLRSLHVARGEYLDQSVRGGTQTNGPLFSRIDPMIRQVRQAVTGAVAAYQQKLPAAEPGHPLLGPGRGQRVRFAGSWSVRLHGGGHHSNHVHPQGWISSALYIALPEPASDDRNKAGWLTLGEPSSALQIALPPLRTIQPRPGQLVLFPSWLWHGTVPFAEGERLTIAFDIAHPR